MAKRKRAPDHFSADEYDDDADSDGSYNGEPSTLTPARARKHRSKPTRKFESLKAAGSDGDESASSSPHAVSLHSVNSENVGATRVALLQWYDRVHETRGMPWRKPFDATLDVEGRAQRAYEVWISEIMLQQTQVATVIPYYKKWMEKYPTIRDLAASDIESVNSLWKGLGYYSRAARLLKGAQKAVADFNGRLPDNAKEMQSQIPGVGRYSAGAVCSIAYNQCVPVLDGNVQRLLSRFLALYAPPKAKQTLDILWAGAEAFIEEANRPGDINQALIELGSTVCKVRDPLCSECPLQPRCQAYQKTGVKVCHSCGWKANAEVTAEPEIEELCTLCEALPEDSRGLVTVYPMKAVRKKAREELDSVNVIEWRSEDGIKRWFLLVRRPEGGLLAGLHEFPTLTNLSGAAASAAALVKSPGTLLERLLVHPPAPYNPKSAGTTLGGATRIVHIKPAGDVVHVFSHIKKTYRVQWVVLEGGGNDPPELVLEPAAVVKKAGGKGKSSGKETGCVAKRRKALEESNVGEGGSTEEAPVSARWIPLDEVEQANIGTGVVKVWNQAKALWTP
ncbi:DNA glycosylase [Leucogyrophana mollusca]|uniref:DNA glycosylase n=1 Tax=Leucogyrophana mollusca TaxID=85980 RepID=A0ACB8BMW6_9AGAM|nr:DNA glycosylase [Leucogyrophana mollusca]